MLKVISRHKILILKCLLEDERKIYHKIKDEVEKGQTASQTYWKLDIQFD